MKEFPTGEIAIRCETLRKVDLINVAGVDVTLRAFNGSDEVGAREVGGDA